VHAQDVDNHDSPPAGGSFVLFADDWIGSRIDLAERTIELYQWLLRR
jgi:hypothetical protein